MDTTLAGRRFGSLLPRRLQAYFWFAFLIWPAAASRVLVTDMQRRRGYAEWPISSRLVTTVGHE